MEKRRKFDVTTVSDFDLRTVFFNLHKKVFFFFIFFPVLYFSQTFILIDAVSKQEVQKKDSISAVAFLDSLANNNYYFTKIIDVKKRDIHTTILYDKGKNYNRAFVHLPDSITKEFGIKEPHFTQNLDSLKLAINQKYLDSGYPFSRIKSKFLKLENGIPHVALSVYFENLRKVSAIKVKGYEKLPRGFKKNLDNKYVGQIYSGKLLNDIHGELVNQPYFQLEQQPQTLFTKDSTQIFLFLKKKKLSSFDGVLGFGNNESKKITVNGTLDLNFQNIFNAFERISIFWQRNPSKGQTFDIKSDVPYLFNTNLGFRMNASIYKQDSTFANAKILPSLYYNVANNHKLGLRGHFETSSAIDSQNSGIKDFTRRGGGIWYEFLKLSDVNLFQYKTKISVETDFLRTSYNNENIAYNLKRYFFRGEDNVHLKGNHYINLQIESSLLDTKQALLNNELFRIGGWNSFRGFNENSLLGDFYVYGGPEYRYLINDEAFFDFFLQYGHLKSKYLNLSIQLYSLGFGFNLFLPIGLMSFQISNGNPTNQVFQFRETKVHWGILTRF